MMIQLLMKTNKKLLVYIPIINNKNQDKNHRSTMIYSENPTAVQKWFAREIEPIFGGILSVKALKSRDSKVFFWPLGIK